MYGFSDGRRRADRLLERRRRPRPGSETLAAASTP